MRLQRRVRFHRNLYKTFLLILIPLYLISRKPNPKQQQHLLKPTLPIHQISLTTSQNQHTTNIISTITLPANKLTQYINNLPRHQIIFLTAACITHPPNLRELLYLSLILHNATAVVPRLSTIHPQTLSHVLPIMTRAESLQAHSLPKVLQSLQHHILEIPTTTALSSCNFFKHPFERLRIRNTSANNLIQTLYGTGQELQKLPQLTSINFTPARQHRNTIMFITPWLQMGGSEQSIFHLATYFKTKGYRLAFVTTQPFWGEREGLLETKNDWIGRAYSLTNHVLDLVNTAPYHERAKLLGYYITSLKPCFIMTSNSRLFYQLLPWVRTLSGDLVIGDYNHMVHIDWRGGGMPRFGANATRYIDRHFAASDNVTDAIKEWISNDGYDTTKAKTCYIGADINRFHNGFKKMFIRRITRARLGIAMNRVLILFAGRFVLDKGIDVIGEVVRKLGDDSRFAFLLVGSGGMENMILDLCRDGSVVVKRIASSEEMSDYYAASDIFLLPSVKEGIALVLYEAMANGLLVISTDVGGQKEVITEDRGILLRRGPTEQVANDVIRTLEDVMKRRKHYSSIRRNGRIVVRQRYNVERFCECVHKGLLQGWKKRSKIRDAISTETIETVRKTLIEDRFHAIWGWRVFPQSVYSVLTIGIMDGCGVEESLTSLKRHYAGIGITRGTRFEELLKDVETELMMILPGGFIIDENTDLQRLVNLVRRPEGKLVFDMMGIHVDTGKAGILKREGKEIIFCNVAEEMLSSDGGGSKVLKSLDAANVVKVGSQVLKIDILKSVFVIRSKRLRDVGRIGIGIGELFLEGFEKGWRVGYVDDISVGNVCLNGAAGADLVDGITNVGDCKLNRDDLLY